MRENREEEVWRVLGELALARMRKEGLPAEVAIEQSCKEPREQAMQGKRRESEEAWGEKSLVCLKVSK